MRELWRGRCRCRFQPGLAAAFLGRPGKSTLHAKRCRSERVFENVEQSNQVFHRLPASWLCNWPPP